MECAEEMPPKTPTFLQIYASPFSVCDRKWPWPAWASSCVTEIQWPLRDTATFSVCPCSSSTGPGQGRESFPNGRGRIQLCALHISPEGLVAVLLIPEHLMPISGEQWRETPWSFVGYALLASVFLLSPSKYLHYNFGPLLCFEYSSTSFLVPATNNRSKVLKT